MDAVVSVEFVFSSRLRRWEGRNRSPELHRADVLPTFGHGFANLSIIRLLECKNMVRF